MLEYVASFKLQCVCLSVQPLHMTNLEFWSTTIVRNAKNTLDHFNVELSCPILLQYNFQSDHHNSKSSTFITPRQANSQLPATPKQKGFTLEPPNGVTLFFWFHDFGWTYYCRQVITHLPYTDIHSMCWSICLIAVLKKTLCVPPHNVSSSYIFVMFTI